MWDRHRAWHASSATESVSGPHHSHQSSPLLSSRRRGVAAAAAAATAAAATSRKAACANKKLCLVRHNDNHKAHSLSSAHSHSHSHSSSQLNLDLETDRSLSAFGITTEVTHKYRIVNGKTVPQSLYPEDPYISLLHHPTSLPSSPPSSPDLKPPPRNPRRLQQLRYQIAFARRSSRNNPDDSDPDHDASPILIRRGVAPNMAQPLVIEPVSPPSSPEIAAWRAAPYPENVSPIDEDSDASLEHFVQAIKGNSRDLTPPAEAPRHSHVPVAQRDLPPAPHRSYPAQAIDQAPAYQQTPSHRKPVSDEDAQWRPQSHLQQPAPTGLRQRHPQQAMIPERDSSFGARSKQAGRRAMPLDARPPWHGASGREQQISAMRDDPNVPPLPIKTGKRNAAKGDSHFRSRLSHMGSPSVDGSSGPGAAMRKLISSRTHKKASSFATQSPRAQYTMDGSQPGPDPYPSPPQQDPYKMASPLPQPQHSPSQSITIKRKPPPTARVDRNNNHAHPLASSPVNEDDVPKPPTPESPNAPHYAHADTLIQPVSRFSMTTFATTIGGASSIESSPAIGMESPSLPAPAFGGPVSRNEHWRSVSDAPIAVRSALAPRPGSATSNNAARTSTGSASDGATVTPRRASLSSLSKPLPPAPPEVSAGDRVAHLTAQLEALANRRININRCVKQMTELIPMDNLLDSDEVQKKRELERKKVDALKTELAEIQREEHELGLMLHRAYKRQNKEAEYEPTTLWVRRVAG